MTPNLFRSLVAQASLAPSVHNVQPARWMQDGDAVWLLEDPSVRLPAADPTGHDAQISLGAALEGMALAAADAGFWVTHERVTARKSGLQEVARKSGLKDVARLTFTPGAAADPLAAHVAARQSWRGGFAPSTETDRDAAMALTAEDCTVVCEPDGIGHLSQMLDTASFGFMERPAFRAELLSWMRLSRSHPDWARDGLNAEAMQLGLMERVGAGFVMGAGFRPLQALRLAATLLAEADKTESAAAIVLFHRPRDEAPLDSGRAFYRVWLRMEAAGFGAAVLAALADDPQAARAASTLARVPEGHRLVSAFRIGRQPPHDPVARARRDLADIIVDGPAPTTV